jgi:hypothetical protein
MRPLTQFHLTPQKQVLLCAFAQANAVCSDTAAAKTHTEDKAASNKRGGVEQVGSYAAG